MRNAANTQTLAGLRPVRPFARILGFLRHADEGYRQRRALERLDPHLRRDIGLTDTQIFHEVGRPIWDAPVVFRQR